MTLGIEESIAQGLEEEFPNEYFEGAPDVVVEICSPDDESYEKLEFYAELGVPIKYRGIS